MEEIYIYLILGIISLFITYKVGILPSIYQKIISLLNKLKLELKEFDRQNKIQSKAHKTYKSFTKNNKEI